MTLMNTFIHQNGRYRQRQYLQFPSFSASPPYRSLSFFSFRIHYMDFPDYLLLLLSISVFLLFSFVLFLHFLVVGSVR